MKKKSIETYKSLINKFVELCSKLKIVDSKETLNSAIDMESEKPGSCESRGNQAFKEGDLQAAEEFYRKLFEAHPHQSHELRERLVQCIQSRGEKDDVFRKIDTDILEAHKLHWKTGYGSISPAEAQFIRDLIGSEKPKKFLEVGTASGLSTGLIANSLETISSDQIQLDSVDLDTNFWVDRTKKTGFLAEEIFQGKMVNVNLVRGLNAPTFTRKIKGNDLYDMMFIDANHQHPWPTLDMIVLLPFLKQSGIIIHHDLALYKKQTPIFGIGPKYLYDQFSEDTRIDTWDHEKNIYAIRVKKPFITLEEQLINSLYLPWTNRKKIEKETASDITKVIQEHWSPKLAQCFSNTLDKFNR